MLRGDTVSAIAARHGVSTASIIAANGLRSDGLIRVGQMLTLPGGTASTRPAAPSSTAAPIPGGNTFAGRTYSSRVVRSADSTRGELAARPAPSRSEMRRIIAQTARAHGVDPALALAISYQESGFDQRRVSVANAIGAMQVIPASGEWMSTYAGRRLDLLDPHDNATAGVLLLRQLRRSAASEEQAIAAYYQGLRSVRERGMFADTRQYVRNVQALRARFAQG